MDEYSYGQPSSQPLPAVATATPPTRVDEFEIIRPLGSGATGQVYQAFDTVLGRAVAVKFLASESSCAAAGERFLIEARAIARLQHPNVLSIYRVGVASGRPYLVEEFVRGDSLDRIKLPMPWRRVLAIAVQLARGLAAAHRQGVLHRDIKPANILPVGYWRPFDRAPSQWLRTDARSPVPIGESVERSRCPGDRCALGLIGRCRRLSATSFAFRLGHVAAGLASRAHDRRRTTLSRQPRSACAPAGRGCAKCQLSGRQV